MATENKKVTFDMNKSWDKIKEGVDNTNKFALEAADDILDGVLKNSAKWQNVLVRATKGGLELNAKQQDIYYETLETLKKQWTTGFKRLRKIFS